MVITRESVYTSLPTTCAQKSHHGQSIHHRFARQMSWDVLICRFAHLGCEEGSGSFGSDTMVTQYNGFFLRVQSLRHHWAPFLKPAEHAGQIDVCSNDMEVKSWHMAHGTWHMAHGTWHNQRPMIACTCSEAGAESRAMTRSHAQSPRAHLRAAHLPLCSDPLTRAPPGVV
jgi:hypothetical protein